MPYLVNYDSTGYIIWSKAYTGHGVTNVAALAYMDDGSMLAVAFADANSIT